MNKRLVQISLLLFGLTAIIINLCILTHPLDDNNSGGIIFATEEVEAFCVGYDKDDDPRFVQYIRQYWIIGPSKEEYNLSNNTKNKDFSQVGQPIFVDEILKNKENGFFVECGAADGEVYSNTIYLERKRGWTGLLIEANTHFYRRLLATHRKAYFSNVCLSARNRSGIFPFKAVGLMGGLDGFMDDNHLQGVTNQPEFVLEIDVQCFNLYSLMLAIGRTHIDYLSLDIEGPELDVLNTIPFNKLHIDIIGLEYRSWGKTHDVNISLERLHNFRSFFKKQGDYKELGILPHNRKDNVANDKYGLDVFFQRIKK